VTSPSSSLPKASSSPASSGPKLRRLIRAGDTERHYWRDLWHYRELFYFLAWRDVLVRYKQTAIGMAWAVLRPLLTMAVLCFVFRSFAGLPSGDVPYPLMVFAAVLPWQFFANALSESSASLIGNANLISKVYFPRLVMPASAVMVSLVDFLVSCLLLGGLFAWYRFVPPLQVVLLPVFTLLAFLVALGPGLLITALNVRYRDFRYVVPFIVQLGLYLSPVGFSTAVVPERWRLLYALNPMVGVIDGFRWALCGIVPDSWVALQLAVVVGGLLLAGGVVYFRRTERGFADVI
jgi:lipopolysaccharide transport system permease protein